VSSRARFIVACAAALAIVLPLGGVWQSSLLPSSYSVMDMGYVDTGGGPQPRTVHAHGATLDMSEHGTTSVRDLTADPKQTAARVVDLVARQGKVKLTSGRVVDGYTLNGKSPGPTIYALPGRLLEVRVKNANVAEGISLHWHGVDLPNAEDGVAGVTQDAVLPGQTHVYRFVPQEGTYWYHSHQVSHEQVIGGLFGALVVDSNQLSLGPRMGDFEAVAHTYAGIRTLNGREGLVTEYLPLPRPGLHLARVRIINTDNGTVQIWSSTAYRVDAIDGRRLNKPSWVTGKRLAVPAGGRADLIVRVPEETPARVQVGATTALVLRATKGPDPAKPAQPTESLDLLSYGQPKKEAITAEKPDRTFRYSIGRRLGFLDGKPGFWWTVNGHLYPNIPMFTVREGDVVKFHIDNHSGESHPMHLHGHHALVVARDGKPVTGAPLWVDSIDVDNDETMDLVFRADNPGIWMDHCHNLTHAAEGLVAHVMYEGVTTPYVVGGKAANQPE
jgi:FtsP/CotA-like multicopper oxidase with cupredoxin domain